MREIKFRHYFPSTGVVTAGHDVMTIILTSTGKEDFWKDAVWMQYTGLKDKNGKEIYEGDIIAWDYEYDADYDGDMPIVKRSAGKAVVKDIFDRWQINEAAKEGKGVEVIGNIYQNPELLKK